MPLQLYVSTLTRLIAHQIDAAYWREWEMFLLPGGVQLFDVFNLLAFPPLLFGLRAVVLGNKSAVRYSMVTGALALLTFAIHLGFFLGGFSQFNLPLSAAIIVGCGLSGGALIVLTLRK